jgi:hypothetical protein
MREKSDLLGAIACCQFSHKSAWRSRHQSLTSLTAFFGKRPSMISPVSMAIKALLSLISTWIMERRMVIEVHPHV